MARLGQHSGSRARRRAHTPNDKVFKAKITLSLLLLSQAEEEEEEITALLIALDDAALLH